MLLHPFEPVDFAPEKCAGFFVVEFSRQAQWSVAVFVQGVDIIHLVKDDLADVGVTSGSGAVQRGPAGSVPGSALVLNPVLQRF